MGKIIVDWCAAAGAAALLYYLLKEEETQEQEDTQEAGNGDVAKGAASLMTKKALLEILKEMADSATFAQENISAISKQLAEADEDIEFDKLYEMVKVPPDPMESRGLTMQDLDTAFQRHSNDREVQQALQLVMSGGAEAASAPADDNFKAITVDLLSEINTFTAEELEKFIAKYSSLPDKSKYAMKPVMLAVQATLNCKVSKKFGYGSEEVQAATMSLQGQLAQNAGFKESFMKMQSLMDSFTQLLVGQEGMRAGGK
jgi:hypothetical protein